MRRVRAGAYVYGDYLIRYLAWLEESWDGTRDRYRPWHIYRRASRIQKRILLECTATLDEAKAYVLAQAQADRAAGQPAPMLCDSA